MQLQSGTPRPPKAHCGKCLSRICACASHISCVWDALGHSRRPCCSTRQVCTAQQPRTRAWASALWAPRNGHLSSFRVRMTRSLVGRAARPFLPQAASRGPGTHIL